MLVEDLGCAIAGRTLLADVSFALARGEAMALLGPSGAGKSLALRCLLGLAPAGAEVRGRLRWEERWIDLDDAAALAKLRGRGLTLVPQAATASLDPMRTIGSQLRELMVLHGTSDAPEARLAEVGLGPEFARRFPFSLSGGQAQRAALALALACRPAVLLADEPTASLDRVGQFALLDLITARCAAHAVGLVLVSHDVALISGRCTKAVVLAAGRVVTAGRLATLLAAPPDPTTAAMVAAARRRGNL